MSFKPNCPKCGYNCNIIEYPNYFKCNFCKITFNKYPGQRKLTPYLKQRERIGNEVGYK